MRDLNVSLSVPDLLCVAGAVLAVVGLAMLSVPVALVAVGAVMVAVGVLMHLNAGGVAVASGKPGVTVPGEVTQQPPM